VVWQGAAAAGASGPRLRPIWRSGQVFALHTAGKFSIVCAGKLTAKEKRGTRTAKQIMSQIDKTVIRKQFQRHERDTGSSEVQAAVLTKEIELLTEHLKINKKDHSSRYGLIRKVNTRRSLLDYLKREDEAVYLKTIKELNLRR
jgi:small subunit ribosomal protein S15